MSSAVGASRLEQARLERLGRWNALLVDLARGGALERGDLTAAIQQITEVAAAALGVARASVWIYNDARDSIRSLDLYQADGAAHSSGVELHARDFPGYFAALQAERTIAADDAHADERTREFSAPYLAPLGINSMLDAPIRRAGKMIGVVCNEQVGPARVWSVDEQAFAGSLADFVTLAIESSERRKVEAALATRVADLARSNAELEQFAYVASHDLQEPLRMVSSYVALLEKRYRGKLDADADKYISYAVEGAKRMHLLINDLLAFSRATRSDAPPERIDCGPVVAGAIANLDRAIGEAGARVRVEGPMPSVLGRDTQLGQVFQNLIENAIKYRKPDVPAEVWVTAARDGDAWRFSVRDNGIGIEPAYHEKIFRIFQRLHERGRYQGNGIGLAIAKRIVESHGGRVWVESTPGDGAVFHFTVPAAGAGG